MASPKKNPFLLKLMKKCNQNVSNSKSNEPLFWKFDVIHYFHFSVFFIWKFVYETFHVICITNMLKYIAFSKKIVLY